MKLFQNIEKYVLPNGRTPFNEWFDAQEEGTQALVDVRLNRLSLGNQGDVKFVGKGVYELRFFARSGFRIYYGRKGNRLVLLCGGNKGSQKRDILRAQTLWHRFLQEEKE